MQLPETFIQQTRQLFGEERFERFLKAFDEEPSVSIRLNPMKLKMDEGRGKGEEGRCEIDEAEQVPWCRHAYYLAKRPNFTFDPLFHAGCYYVQEAASMFLDEVLRQLVNSEQLTVNSYDYPSNAETGHKSNHNYSLFTINCQQPNETGHKSNHNYSLFTIHCHQALDLCAAPGGKSTLLRTALPPYCVLYSNEPMKNRASILLENVTKWGYDHHHVTNLYPKDYRKAKMKFDLILCDVPCSGEGMFRKDEATIKEWSPQNVEHCWQLQREIVADAWACLNEGGILIYSTCTFNTKENEENIRWILEEFDAEVLPIATKPEWNITGSLLEGFDAPVYRFIPGITRSEGLFMCVLRKGGKRQQDDARRKAVPLRLMQPDFGLQPSDSKHQSSDLSLPTSDIKVELSYAQAINYLRHEALVLPPDTPRGLVEVCFMGHPLGLMKNIGNRANNLYPKEWRIKTTHVPQDYEPVLRLTDKPSE